MPGFVMAAAKMVRRPLFCKTLMKKIAARPPAFARMRSEPEVAKILRCLVDLEFRRHGKPISREASRSESRAPRPISFPSQLWGANARPRGH